MSDEESGSIEEVDEEEEELERSEDLDARRSGTIDEDEEEEEVEEEDEEGEGKKSVPKVVEEDPPVELTVEQAGKGLSLLGKTADGLSYAYLLLSATNKNLTDVSVIPNFLNVLFVDVSGNRLTIEDLLPLTKIEFLLALVADRNRITSAALPPMPYLQILSLNKNQITSLDGITHPLLECLELNYNKIAEVESESLRTLKVLELRGNVLTTTAGISFPCLDSLYLAENKLEKLEGMDQLVNLRTLHLRDNPLQKLDGFSDKMAALNYVNLRKNKVSVTSEFKKLECLPNLETVVVSENPFSEENEEDYRVDVLLMLPKLKKLDKTPVSSDEREEVMEMLAQREEMEEEEEEQGEEEGGEEAEGEGDEED